MTDYRQLTQEVSAHLLPLRQGVPGVMKGFAEMGKAAIADGALDAKTKELVALAIGVAARCAGCIGFHARALASLGATEAEVHEVLGVAIYMGGGPSAMLPRAPTSTTALPGDGAAAVTTGEASGGGAVARARYCQGTSRSTTGSGSASRLWTVVTMSANSSARNLRK